MSFFARFDIDGVKRSRLPQPLFLSVLLFCLLGVGISTTLFQRTRKERVAPGIIYYHFMDPIGPVNFDVLRIFRREKFLKFHAVLGDGVLTGLVPVSQQVNEVNVPAYYPVAAVNGDFFRAGGIPLGLMVSEREIITVPVSRRKGTLRPAFAVYVSGRPDIVELSYRGLLALSGGNQYEISGVNRPRPPGGIVLYNHRFGKSTPAGEHAVDIVLRTLPGRGRDGRWRLMTGRKYRGRVASVAYGGNTPIPPGGAVISASGSSASALRTVKKGSRLWFRFERVGGRGLVNSAVGGGPVIVRNGRNMFRPGKDARHPRTAVGFNRKEIYLVVVDGRRAGWSRGMSLYELGELMLKMNCREALNLDGGGSSTIWVRGSFRNKVSDGKERPVSNSLVITSSAPRTGRLQRLAVEPSELSILTGNSTRLYASGRDKYYNPVPLEKTIEWNCDPEIGTITRDGVFKSAARRASGRIRVRAGALVQLVDVEVYEEPPIFQVYPTIVHLFRGESRQFRYLAMDHRGLPVRADYSKQLRWSVTPGIGRLEPTGILHAGDVLARGEVTVRLGRKVRRSVVTVGTVPELLDDFERISAWGFASHPDNKVGGAFSVTANAAYRGVGGGMLMYNFDDRFETEAAYARTQMNLGAPMAVKMWVRGDGSSHRLRMAYRNRYDGRKTVPFDEGTLSIPYWHPAVAKVPPDEAFPLRLESIYVLKDPQSTSHYSGAISFDELYGLYPPR